jgi:hypothetical protein
MRLRRISLLHVLVVTVAFGAFILSTPIAANAAVTPCTCSISVSPTSGSPGSAVLVTGTGYTPGGTVRIQFRDSASVRTLVAKNVVVDSGGGFAVAVTVPATAALGVGKFVANEKAFLQRAKAPFTVTAGK